MPSVNPTLSPTNLEPTVIGSVAEVSPPPHSEHSSDVVSSSLSISYSSVLHSPLNTYSSSAVVRRSSRILTLPSKYNDFLMSKSFSHLASIFNVYFEPSLNHLDPSYLASLANIIYVPKPSSYLQAKDDPKWVAAMVAWDQNQTSVLTTLPHGKTAIGSKWVYKAQFNSDGSLQRCKARLVGKGYK